VSGQSVSIHVVGFGMYGVLSATRPAAQYAPCASSSTQVFPDQSDSRERGYFDVELGVMMRLRETVGFV